MSYRLENQVLDFYDDANSKNVIAEVASRIPGHVKTAAAPVADSQRQDKDFALCLMTKQANKLCRYPIDTAADTFFSNEYLQRNYHKLPAGAVKVAAANISKACQRYGLQPSAIVKEAARDTVPNGNIYFEPMHEANGFVYDEILLKQAAAEIPSNNAAFDDSPFLYALVKKASNGNIIMSKYAMPDAGTVRRAIDYFDKYASEFSPADRQQFAYNVTMRARELGVPCTSQSIAKFAGVGGYNPDLEAHLSLRKSCCIDGERVAAYDRLYEKRASISPELFAQTLEQLDKRAGVNRYYGGHIADAYTAAMGASAFQKKASTTNWGEGRNRDLVEQHFGKEVADLLAKEGEAAVEALPNDAKEILAAIASGAMG
jgi:hypothetical protein